MNIVPFGTPGSRVTWSDAHMTFVSVLDPTPAAAPVLAEAAATAPVASSSSSLFERFFKVVPFGTPGSFQQWSNEQGAFVTVVQRGPEPEPAPVAIVAPFVPEAPVMRALPVPDTSGDRIIRQDQGNSGVHLVPDTYVREEAFVGPLVEEPEALGGLAGAAVKRVLATSAGKAALAGAGLTGASLAAGPVANIIPEGTAAGDAFVGGVHAGHDLIASSPLISPSVLLPGGATPLDALSALASRNPPVQGGGGLFPEKLHVGKDLARYGESVPGALLEDATVVGALAVGVGLGGWGHVTDEGAEGISRAFQAPPERVLPGATRPDPNADMGPFASFDPRNLVLPHVGPAPLAGIGDFMRGQLSPALPESPKPEDARKGADAGKGADVPVVVGGEDGAGDGAGSGYVPGPDHVPMTVGPGLQPWQVELAASVAAAEAMPGSFWRPEVQDLLSPPSPGLLGFDVPSVTSIPATGVLVSSPVAAVAAPGLPGTSMIPVLGMGNGILDAAKGAASQIISAAQENPGATAAIGAGVLALGATGAVVATRKRSSSKKRKAKPKARARTSKAKPKKLKRAKAGKARVSSKKGKREDRRGVTRSTYRGQKVYTHKGRHYVIRKRAERTKNGGVMAAGTWKYINS